MKNVINVRKGSDNGRLGWSFLTVDFVQQSLLSTFAHVPTRLLSDLLEHAGAEEESLLGRNLNSHHNGSALHHFADNAAIGKCKVHREVTSQSLFLLNLERLGFQNVGHRLGLLVQHFLSEGEHSQIDVLEFLTVLYVRNAAPPDTTEGLFESDEAQVFIAHCHCVGDFDYDAASASVDWQHDALLMELSFEIENVGG